MSLVSEIVKRITHEVINKSIPITTEMAVDMENIVKEELIRFWKSVII